MFVFSVRDNFTDADNITPFDYLRQILYTDEDSVSAAQYDQSSRDDGGGDGGESAAMPQCPHCHRFYETKIKLKAHIQKYCLKEKKYKCFYCSYRSKRRDHIRRHMLRVHAALMNKRVAQGLSMDIDATLNETAAAEAAAGVAVDELNDSNSNYYKNEDIKIEDVDLDHLKVGV